MIETRTRANNAMTIIEKLAAAERRFFAHTFLAPVTGGKRLRLRVCGATCEIELDEAFEGWAILRISAAGRAQRVDAAQPALIEKYLRLLPRVRLVLVQTFGKKWWAIAAARGVRNLQLNAPVPVYLVDGARAFDTVYCRFDGDKFLFEGIDRRRDPKIAKTLNQAIVDRINPDDLRCTGAVPQEKLAYRMRWVAETETGDSKKSDLANITSALKHAGANLESFWYHDADQATVRFQLDGYARTVQIRTNDLSVASAGICLSGANGDFDLASVVGVLREAERSYID